MAVKNLPIPIQGIDDHDSFSLEPQYASTVRNVRSNRRRIVRSPGAALMAPPPGTGPARGMETGTFTMNTSTGNQTISHGLGTTPKALILYTVGVSAFNTAENDSHFSVGMTDGTTSRCAAIAANNTNPQNTSHAWQNTLFTIIEWGETTLSTASWVSWNSTEFVINWSVVDGVARKMGYILFAHASLSAKVLEWTLPASTGNTSVTGAGFQPTAAIHIHSNITAAGVFPNSFYGHGAMVANGQWAIGTVGDDNAARNKQNFTRRDDSAIAMPALNAVPANVYRAGYVSFDADGFTMNVAEAPPSGVLIGSLVLAGFTQVGAGLFEGTPLAPPSTVDVDIGFEPNAVLTITPGLHSVVNDFTNASSYQMGVTDGVRQNAGSTGSDNSSNRTKTLMHKNCCLLTVDDSGLINMEAIFKSFIDNGYRLNVVFGLQAFHNYFAFSLPNTFGIIRNYAQLYVGAATAVEKFLMLTSRSAYIYVPGTSSTGTWGTSGETYTGADSLRFSIVNTQTVAAWSQGVDNIRQYDGTSYSDLITVGQNHAARTLLAFADRIVSIRPFYGGIDHATQIRWSVNGNVNDWLNTGSGVLEIVETSQDPLTGGFVLGDRAYLAKERELIELIWTGTGSPVFGTQPRIRGMGVLASNSIALAEQVAFWLGPDDVYMWDGSTLTAIGDRIYNTIDPLIDYNALDQIQGAVWTPDSLYLLVVPPYLFVYDYRRDIWYQDDTSSFEAIGIFGVGTNFTADIDHSDFIVIGDSSGQTVRLDQSLTDYLGNPIDSYFVTRDYTAEELVRGGQGFQVSLWNINSLREVRFQAPAGNVVEVGVSTDRGVTYQVTNVTVNANGVGVAWFQIPFSQIRFRFRNFGIVDYEIHGQWGTDTEDSGYQLP